jgi:hypothetical protein
LITSQHADTQIGDAGAAAVAGALEPRSNVDGDWTPSTALTELWLGGEWALILMVVTEEGWGCSCVAIVDRPLPFRLHKHGPAVQVYLSIVSVPFYPIYIDINIVIFYPLIQFIFSPEWREPNRRCGVLVVTPFALYRQRPSCLSVLSVHIPTLSNIKLEYFNSTHIRFHHNLITQTVAQSKCLDSAISTTPSPSLWPPLTRHHQRNGSLATKRMDRCIAKALPNQTIFTICSLLVILSFSVMRCFLNSAHSPLTSRRTTDEKSIHEWASHVFGRTAYCFMIFLFT